MHLFCANFRDFCTFFVQTNYLVLHNTQRPCFAIGYDTPENYRKRYYKVELPKKNTFEGRTLTSEPKFVQKRRQYADNQDNCKGLSTFEEEISGKS